MLTFFNGCVLEVVTLFHSAFVRAQNPASGMSLQVLLTRLQDRFFRLIK